MTGGTRPWLAAFRDHRGRHAGHRKRLFAGRPHRRRVEQLGALRDAGAVMCTWLSIITELGVDFASQYGDGMKAIIGTHWPASTVGPVDDSTPDGHGMQFTG